MQLSQPQWLWALAGLLIPVTIHLLRRQSGRVIMMGSLRYLRESRAAKHQHLRLNEIGLLSLRCFMVSLLVLLLAGAGATRFPWREQKWLVLEEGVDKSGQIKSIIENLEAAGFETHLMAMGFPRSSNGAVEKPVNDYWAAVRMLTALSLDSVVVISFNYLRKFKGSRVPMPANMKWLIAQSKKEEFTAQKRLMDDDSVWVRQGTTSPFETRYETIKRAAIALSDSIPATPATHLNISVFAGEGFTYDKQILEASLKAIQSVIPIRITFTSRKVTDAGNASEDILFWLANEPPPIREGVTTFAYCNCARDNLPLLAPDTRAIHAFPHPQNVTWLITKRLNEEIALKENLALRLAKLILPNESDLRIDQRVLPEAMMWASEAKTEFKAPDDVNQRNLDLPLVIALLVTLLAERTLAFKKGQ